MKTLSTQLLILIFCFFLFSFGSQNLSLEFKGDENFYFESAKEMLESGDVVTPRYRGEERFQKPIFFYWLILSSFRIFGVNWFAARLPSVLFGAFLALLVFAISNLFFKDKAIGLFATLFSVTTPLYYRYARLALPDMALVFFITLALYCFLRLYKNRNDKRSARLFFLAMALAFLVKGPVGLIIPLLIVCIFCLIKKENPFSLIDALTGIAIFALIVVPWFYFIYRIHGETYLNHIWVREILQRLGQGHAGSFVIRYFKGLSFYINALITGFLPYSLFIPLAFINSSKVLSIRFSSKSRQEGRDAHLFLILWIAVVFLFFTFVAEKRTHYLLALSPAISILIGAVFKSAILDKKFFSRPLFKVPYLATLIGLVFFTIVFVFSDYIAGGNKVAIWKFALMIVPIILILGFRYRNGSFMPMSLALSLSIIYVTMTASTPFGLFMNKMERAAAIIKSDFKEGDRIGIGSHGIIPEELQAFFEIPVENIKVRYKHDGTPNFGTAYPLKNLLKSEERVFCVIKRRDYDNFIPEEMKENLYILGSYYVWKRRIRVDKELKGLLDNVETRPFREFFQNEIYVISNRK